MKAGFSNRNYPKLLLMLIFFLLFQLYFVDIIKAQGRNGTIGLSLAELNVPRWDIDSDYFVWSAKAIGYNVIVKDAENNSDTQIEQVNELIKSGIRALVIIPVDGNKDAVIVENAHKHGVKVIAYDRIIKNCDLDGYISFNNEMIGEIMAIYITNYVNKGNFMNIGGPKTDPNSFDIHTGLLKIMNSFIKSGNASFVCDTFVSQWNKAESYKIVKEYLNSNRPIPVAIYNANDELALGTIEALEEKNLDGKVYVTGQDADLIACRNIISGKQSLTIFKPIRILAEKAALMTAMILGDINYETITTVFNGKKNVPSFIINPTPVDKANMANTIIIDGFHTERELYK
jgi:D-xylose transport system substrate-binding protein